MPKNQSSDRLVFAVDLGGTHLRVALVDDTGRILKQLKQETPRGDSASCIINALANAAEQWNDEKQRVAAASIMVPGAVDSDKAVVLQAPNLPSLINFDLKAALEQRLGWPVFLENDANAAAVGEMWLGAARGCRDVMSVTLGTGVGGGLIFDGKLWRGPHGGAGGRDRTCDCRSSQWFEMQVWQHRLPRVVCFGDCNCADDTRELVLVSRFEIEE